jgi:hypothetical protein
VVVDVVSDVVVAIEGVDVDVDAAVVVEKMMKKNGLQSQNSVDLSKKEKSKTLNRFTDTLFPLRNIRLSTLFFQSYLMKS